MAEDGFPSGSCPPGGGAADMAAPLALDSEAEARGAAKVFNDQRRVFEPNT